MATHDGDGYASRACGHYGGSDGGKSDADAHEDMPILPDTVDRFEPSGGELYQADELDVHDDGGEPQTPPCINGQCVRTAAAVVSWFTLNILIATINKWVISVDHFEYPALLTDVHMVMSYILSSISLATFLPADDELQPTAETMKNVQKLSVAFCLSVFSGNMALQFIFVSFSQMVGAASPMITLILSKMLTTKKYGVLAYMSMVPMCGGVMLCVTGELNFNVIGLILVVSSCVLRGIKSIMQGALLTSQVRSQQLDALSLLKHMSKYSVVLLTGYALVTGEVQRLLTDERVHSAHVTFMVILSGVVAFALNLANFLVTKYTSAVTLQVLGNIKVVLSIAISLLVFHNPLSVMSIIGCGFTLLGVAMYQRAMSQNDADMRKC